MKRAPCLRTKSSGPHLKASPAPVRRSKRVILAEKFRVMAFWTSSPKVALLRMVKVMVAVGTSDLWGLYYPTPRMSVNLIVWMISSMLADIDLAEAFLFL